jgi:hypothetical protein
VHFETSGCLEKQSRRILARVLGLSMDGVQTNDRFMMLQKSCGGLTSAFPNTATVESDFSIIGWEKNDN